MDAVCIHSLFYIPFYGPILVFGLFHQWVQQQGGLKNPVFVCEFEDAMIPLHKITHRGGARTQVLPFGGQETPVLQADGMGIGVADGKRNHGFSCLAYIDGNGGDAGCLAFTGLHCVGEKVAQYGAEVRIRQGEGFGQGDGGLHPDALVPGQMDVVIQNGVGGNIGTVLDCGKGFKTAQVFIDVFQGAVRFLSSRSPFMVIR